MTVINLYTDGGSRRNPGPAAAAWVLKDDKDRTLEEGGRFLGRATNNEAEYQALIEGLRRASTFRPRKVTCFLDSELLVKQLKGIYRTKEPRLQKLLLEVKNLEAELGNVFYRQVPRHQNQRADELVNEILDRHR